MKYGYARVSTKGQDLTTQVQELEAEGCDAIYQEKLTGTNREGRTQFNILLNKLEQGDTLTVTKLDRFARSAKDATAIITDLFERGVKVHVLNMGLIEDTPTGKLIFNVMVSFAQFERDMIVQRTQEGKALAKEKDDFHEGRPEVYGKKQKDHALELLNKHSYKEVERLTGISKSTLQRAKRKQQAETSS